MSNEMNRRRWLKSTALLTGGLTLGTASLRRTLAANHLLARARQMNFETESALVADLPVMKARLLANENPFGPSAKAKQAMTEALATSYQYPFMQMRGLQKMIADQEGVTPEHVMLGAGSSELLAAAAILYAAKGNIVTADPSYLDLVETAADFGAPIEKVPLDAAYAHDLPAMEKRINAKTSLVYLCNPNNPTGTVIAAAPLRAFCETVSGKTPIFIDEAYIDYADPARTASMIECVRKGQNVIVARTFSKLHAFAGLRVGYVIAQPDVVKAMGKYASGGMGISAPSIRGAMASYQDIEYVAYAKAKNAESKEFLYQILKAEGYDYVPSHANFVLFPLKMSAVKFREEMMKRGVGLRSWEFAGKQWCRISIGTMDDMKTFAAAFKELS
ncbi:MAG: histidinol-phosphate aminotransferase family protein [Ferruginibacter sp.]|nr:histidinol-phosphate aminotransferase family protein [Cytophagales bacterium]